VPPSVTPAEVEALVARTGYSRFPVVDGAYLTGYVHVKDVLGAPDRDRRVDPALVRSLPEVGEDTPLRAALRQMQTTGAHLTKVVDPEGRPSGVVMLEDALEELVGEVTDSTRRH
jgi:CBS domain containing-hemolysin-like protein